LRKPAALALLVNTNPIMGGKHQAITGGKHRAAIDMALSRKARYASGVPSVIVTGAFSSFRTISKFPFSWNC